MSSPPEGRAYAVVIPTVGRDSLRRLLAALSAQRQDPHGWPPAEVVVVDDRGGGVSLELPVPTDSSWQLRVLRSGGRGPAAARNVGWRATSAEWIVFLDDDVVLPADWSRRLATDLAACEPDVAGSQARIDVPLPDSRRPTDWERNTAGLERAAWATADMAYRRTALLAVGGFDERFPRAYREDADLALRVRHAGWRLAHGQRRITHPVRSVDDWVSVRVQAGNADDALMRRLHGADWRSVADVGRGRLPWHALTVGSAVAAVAGLVAHRPRLATTAVLAWTGLTAEFCWRRLAPGPRPGDDGFAAELRRMVLTSAVIPFAAVRHRLAGTWRHRRGAEPWPPPVRAVLFDRDGTLVHDVPYNGDPERVRVVEGAAEALHALRTAGVKVGVITNQSGIGRGLLTPEAVGAVNARVEAELGFFDTWQVCPHAPDDGCACRKPGPELVRRAARELAVPVEQCAVVGDIGADVQAARQAGARPVLVPTPLTRPEEVAEAPVVADNLADAVELLLDNGQRPAGDGDAALRAKWWLPAAHSQRKGTTRLVNDANGGAP